MRVATPDAIHRAWWDLCEQGRAVTVRGLAAALGLPEPFVRQALGSLNYLQLIDPPREGATPGATST